MSSTFSVDQQNENQLKTQVSQDLLEAFSLYPALLHHEESISKSPYHVSAWMIYLEEIDGLLSEVLDSTAKTASKSSAAAPVLQLLIRIRDSCGRRAVRLLPKSYKLWKVHWEFIIQQYKRRRKDDDDGVVNFKTVIQLFERALVTLHSCPRVWIEYLHFAHTSGYDDNNSNNHVGHPTKLRRLANRALEALPVTQHDKIWPVLLQYYQTPPRSMSVNDEEEDEEAQKDKNNGNDATIPAETKVCMLRRYLQYNPLATKEVADFLSDELGRWGEAAILYKKMLDTPESITVAQRQELWMSLAKVCTNHATEESGNKSLVALDWDKIVRAVLSNLSKYLPDAMEGFVWNQLADWWIRRGEFQLARSVYEEALESVQTVRDFTILLDAYLQFEEGLLEATMENQREEEYEDEGTQDSNEGGIDDEDWDILLRKKDDDSSPAAIASSMADLELAMARAEDLTARRPLLLNRVLLKQSPHDVGEWLKRSRLYLERDNPDLAASALEEALLTVQARRAVLGNPSQLVIQLSKIYEENCDDLARARNVFERVCEEHVYEFKTSDDLAECYAAWVELELRHEAWDSALEIVRRSVVPPPQVGGANGTTKVIKGAAKSSRLWDLLFDLEESLGTVQTTKDAYNRALEIKVATPLHVLNFASFLIDQKYFEEAFTVYERGVDLFEFPAVKAIWKSYLEAFLERYKGTKIERTRDLFQRCIDSCPAEDCSEFFIKNGEFEEEYGLTKRALGVYRQLCQKVPSTEKYTAYQLFIAKTTKYMGLTATRDIYQAAIAALTDDTSAAQVCLDFSKMETSLQEIDRARAILTYGAQMADPRRNELYWKTWKDFEVSHGNEETFREMLRVKRSVEAAFSTVNYNAAEMSTTSGNVDPLSNEQAMQMIAEREGVEVDHAAQSQQQSAALAGFVSASKKRPAPASVQLDDVEERVSKLRKAAASAAVARAAEVHGEEEDEDEIDLDDVEEDAGDREDGDEAPQRADQSPYSIRNVSTRAVPAAVFGGLANLAQKGEDEDAPKGALERLRAAKK